MNKLSASVLVLTYNRPNEIQRNLSELVYNLSKEVDVVVVDNYSDLSLKNTIDKYSERVKFIRTDENIGVAARNIGMKACKSDIVITLDDDVFGLTQKFLDIIVRKFNQNSDLSAINFKVIDDATEEQINWIHHRKLDDWCGKEFESYEISEGAVAFRRLDFMNIGGYPSDFFISHEGPYLALNLLKDGKTIIYSPDVIVRHAHAEGGRSSWRRYYYDTRNVIWMCTTHFPIPMAAHKCTLALGSLLIYAIRDGYSRYWAKGVLDGFLGIRPWLARRKPIKGAALDRYRSMAAKNASFWYMLKKRLKNNKSGVRI
jgi:GT2 family glycosyltransferase